MVKTNDPVAIAYQIIYDVMFNEESDIDDYKIAAEQALGYLGQALDD